MANLMCEDFEREYNRLADPQADPLHQKRLQEHRQNCPHCRAFGSEAQTLRTVLSNLPKLETSPQFIFNLRREINLLENPRTGFHREPRPLPHSLALSAGFALAVFLGVLLLRPLTQVQELTTSPSGPRFQTAQIDPPQTKQTSPVVATRPEPQLVVPRNHDLYASGSVARDTSVHRLPEVPGKDSIPIPVDDYWRMNRQVSTLQAGP